MWTSRGIRRNIPCSWLTMALAACFLLGWALAAAFAQSTETPTLTEAQRWQLTALTQRLELAQLRAQIAQRDFDAARAELVTVAKKLEREGYELDLAAMAYKPARMPQEPRPAPEPAPTGEAKP